MNDNQPPVPVVAMLPALSAVCSANITTIPQATDNCAGLIAATTNSPLTYNQPGIYTINWVYTDNNNNTSSQFQQIIINNIDTSFTVDTIAIGNQIRLTANLQAANVSYTWLDCNNNLIIGNSQSIIPQSTGSYALVVNYAGCIDTSACIQINLISVNQDEIDLNFNEIEILPNPAADFVQINNIAGKVNIEIVSLEGKVKKSLGANKNTIIGIEDLIQGMYLIKIQSDRGVFVKKFFKE
jgi:hypothetical protein